MKLEVEKAKRLFILWAETERFEQKVAEAKQIIESALARYNKPYVAFSGGKDSTVMLHLVLQYKPDVMVFLWDYGKYLLPRKIFKEILNIADTLKAHNLRIETTNAYLLLKDKAHNIKGSVLLEHIIPSLKNIEGYDCVFVGLREEESLKRRRRMHAQKNITCIPEVWPLATWRWLDIWAYIFKHNLPYISIYNLYGPLVGWDKARFVSFFDHDFDHLGASNVDSFLMWKFKHEDRRDNTK